MTRQINRVGEGLLNLTRGVMGSLSIVEYGFFIANILCALFRALSQLLHINCDPLSCLLFPFNEKKSKLR